MRRALAWSGPIVAAGAVPLLAGGASGDSYVFVTAGRTLFSTHWSHAFAHKVVQAGPLQLALFGSIGRSSLALGIVVALATILLLLWAFGAVGVKDPMVVCVVGVFAVGVSFTRFAYESGHPADAVLPLIWTLAAVHARRDHVARAGLLVGLSAGLETWGILGVAVLALAPRWRAAGRGVSVAAGVTALLFLPFVLGGHFAMGAYHWQVKHPALLSLLVPAGTPFGWQLRLLQGAVAVSAGVAMARLMRRLPHAPWVVPLVVVGARLLADPLLLWYYKLGLEGPVLVGAALFASRLTALKRKPRESLPLSRPPTRDGVPA
jgi:hypothetical protein